MYAQDYIAMKTGLNAQFGMIACPEPIGSKLLVYLKKKRLKMKCTYISKHYFGTIK
jgi:hypothetical protein